MAARELSFDEFRAIRRRRATDRDDADPKPTPDDPPAAAPDPPKGESGRLYDSLAARAGVVAEMEEVQLASATLILVDLAASAVRCAAPSGIVIVARFVEALTGFTVFAFLFELVALVAAFGIRACATHPGYAVDGLVVGLCLRADLVDADDRARHLVRLGGGFLRLWRFARYHDAVVARHRAETLEAQDRVEAEQTASLRAQLETAKVEASLRDARAAQTRLEHMCKAYKDEIDTLNEALAIAAMDVAEAADEELEEGDGDGDEVPVAPIILTARKMEPSAPPAKARFVVEASGAYRREV